MAAAFASGDHEHSDGCTFDTDDVLKLLENKFVCVIGDSVMRAVYKDLLMMITDDRLLTFSELRTRGELSFIGDKLVEGGRLKGMTNGKDYTEVRNFQRPYYMLRFYFVTRCYSSYMETVIADLAQRPYPAVIIMSSCLWDITRYGKDGMEQYEINLQMLFRTFQKVLSKKAKNTLFIWTTALPVSKDVRGGVILQEINFLAEILRYDVLLANHLSSRLATHYGFDVLDLHHAMRRHISWRLHDGIHWNAVAHRKITGMLLHHICVAWHVQLPARIATRYTIPSMPTLQTGCITGYGNRLSSGSEDTEGSQSTSPRAAASQAEGNHAAAAEMDVVLVSYTSESEEGEITE